MTVCRPRERRVWRSAHSYCTCVQSHGSPGCKSPLRTSARLLKNRVFIAPLPSPSSLCMSTLPPKPKLQSNFCRSLSLQLRMKSVRPSGGHCHLMLRGFFSKRESLYLPGRKKRRRHTVQVGGGGGGGRKFKCTPRKALSVILSEEFLIRIFSFRTRQRERYDVSLVVAGAEVTHYLGLFLSFSLPSLVAWSHTERTTRINIHCTKSLYCALWPIKHFGCCCCGSPPPPSGSCCCCTRPMYPRRPQHTTASRTLP